MMILFVLTLFILVEVCAAAYDVSFAKLTASTSYDSTAICSNGDVVVGGGTTGLIGFPSAGGWDFMVQRFSSTGTLLWTTVWGGTEEDYIEGVSVDDNDNVYITGYTRSTPTAGAAVTVAKIGSSGILIYSHDYGGTSNTVDAGNAVSVDSARGVFYVVGYTHSSTFQGLPLNAAVGGFLLKVNCSDGDIIATTLYSRRNYYLYFSAVTTDSTGAVWVVGRTTSPSYNGTASKGDYDIIVNKFSASGTFLFGKMLGSTSTDSATGVACDNDGNVYVIGSARLSVDSQTFLGGISDIVVAKYSSDGTKLWTKLLGSAGDEYPLGIAVDSYKGLVYATGYTRTSSFYGSTSILTASTPFFLALHSANGDYVYSQIFPATGNSAAQAQQAQFRGIANRGEVLYVAGYTQGHILGVTKPGAMGGWTGVVAKLGNGTSTIALTRGPTIAPTFMPSIAPTASPTVDPTFAPTTNPTVDPTANPTVAPTASPSADPTFAPTADPTVDPTANPTVAPTASPTVDPTFAPTADPTVDPTANPTVAPTASPSVDPTFAPTADPTVDPTANPTVAPTASPTVDPTVSPTATPSFAPSLVPTASPTRVCLQWALGDYGESCSTTCSKLSRTCKDKYLKDVVTQEAFYAVVGSAVNVRSGGAVGTTETFCSLTTESVVAVGAPAALSVVLSSEDHHSPVRTSCSYPTSATQVTAGCDTILPLRNFRRFCPCVDQNCDEGDHAGTWYLGHSGDSCDATCSIAGGLCDAEPLSSVTNAAIFTSVVASTVSLETNNIIGSSSTEFCQQGINVFPFAPAPVVITLNFGAANDTLCSYPTDVSNLQGSCDMAFTDPPAQRFCNCKQTIAPPQSERRALFTPAAPAVIADPASVFSAGVSNATPRLRGKVV